MSTLIAVGIVVAAAAAVRGTWSPCGLSMLSTVTPLAEAGRGHRYRWTASWFFVGAVLGGATTGLAAAALVPAISMLGLSGTARAGIAAVAALAAAALDAQLLGPPIPHHRRQVNEEWLNRYRAWVYGSGFGWQIGTGVATYIMTAAVYLVIVLGVMSGSPATAFALCVLFGACRGSMVVLGAQLTSAERLRSFHQRFEAWREPVRRTVIVVEVVAATTIAIDGGTAVVMWTVAGAAAIAALGALRSTRRSAPTSAPDACSLPGSAT